jgi:hypothetical protein
MSFRKARQPVRMIAELTEERRKRATAMRMLGRWAEERWPMS